MRLGNLLQPQDRLHHPLHLRLLGAPVAADGLLDVRGCVLNGFDAGELAGDEDGAPSLPDRECGAGVGADEGLLERDGIGPVVLDEVPHLVVDPPEADLGPLTRSGLPPAEVERREAVSSSLDDGVPACSRSRIDADDLHAARLGTRSDVPPTIRAANPLDGPRSSPGGMRVLFAVTLAAVAIGVLGARADADAEATRLVGTVDDAANIA